VGVLLEVGLQRRRVGKRKELLGIISGYDEGEWVEYLFNRDYEGALLVVNLGSSEPSFLSSPISLSYSVAVLTYVSSDDAYPSSGEGVYFSPSSRQQC
jgi:hypothetical protein